MRPLWQWRYIFMGYIWRGQQMNRITEVEEQLRWMATGKLPLPDKSKCLELAIRIGTPKEHWPKVMKEGSDMKTTKKRKKFSLSKKTRKWLRKFDAVQKRTAKSNLQLP